MLSLMTKNKRASKERAVGNDARKLRPRRYERGAVEGLQHFTPGGTQEGLERPAIFLRRGCLPNNSCHLI
jgi:hypothetical protein